MHPILLHGQWTAPREPLGSFHAVDPATRRPLTERTFPVSSRRDLEALRVAGKQAADAMLDCSPEELAAFLEAYAEEIEGRAEELVEAAHGETGLPREPRLRESELPRTVGQLRQAAKVARDRSWRRATIDTGANIRSLHGPLGGPVLIFGPNNFPFAYNGIAGGDFAAAIAAGNPVIAKAHPHQPFTTTLLAEAVLAALGRSRLPAGAVQLFYHTEPELGLELVGAPEIGAVAFTGSRKGGLALKEAADRAGTPAYLEMSSVNPVFILPGALEDRRAAIAEELTTSCTQNGGQFCTQPGLLVVQAGGQTEPFVGELAERFAATTPDVLLTPDLPESMASAVRAFRAEGAELLTGGGEAEGEGYAFQPTLLRVSGETFLRAPENLASEAFGPLSLVVETRDAAEMEAVAEALEGNLTGSLYSASDGREDAACARLARILRRKVGRLLNDKVPTGVTVCAAMNHGGPFPATGHPGFTAVGFPASLLRFTALHCYDHVRPHRLPPELQDPNPTGSMWRLIDGVWTQQAVPPAEAEA